MTAHSSARIALQVLSRLALPLTLLLGAFVLVYLGGVLPLSRLSVYLTHAVLVLGIGISLVFRSGRALFALLTLGLAYVAQQVWVQEGLVTPVARGVYLAIVLIVPINLALLALLQERGTINRSGAERLAVITAEAVIVAVIVAVGGGALLDWFSGKFLPVGLGTLPHLGLLVIIAGVVAALVAAYRSRSAVSASCAGAIVAFAVAVHVPAAYYTAAVFILAAALMVIFAVLHDAFRVAFRDRQTGLPNRQALEERLEALPRRYALAMVDIDRFAEFNSAHGSELGDQALRAVAARIRLAVGRGNAYRYAGEEFAIILPRTNATDALPRLEALRENVESYLIALRSPQRARSTRRARRAGGWRGSDTVSVTISIGVADNSDAPTTPREVLGEAERALGRAKEKGRNAVSR